MAERYVVMPASRVEGRGQAWTVSDRDKMRHIALCNVEQDAKDIAKALNTVGELEQENHRLRRRADALW